MAERNATISGHFLGRVASRIKRFTPTNWLYLVLHLFLFGLGIPLLQSSNTKVVSVGTSLVATGLAGWVLFVWVLLHENQAKRIEMLSNIGLVDAFSFRAAKIKDEYDQRLVNACESIDVLGFGLRQMREDYGVEFANWSQRAKVRILLLDPNAPDIKNRFADQRDLEEGNPVGSIASDVNAFLQQTSQLRADPTRRFQVRLYRTIPSINIFRVDDSIFWGPYLIKKQSRNTHTFLVQRGGTLFGSLQEHFDQLWKDEEFSHEP